MFLRLLTASALLCLSARAQATEEPQEVMPREDFLSNLSFYRTPATFTSSCTPDAADLVFGLDGSASINVQYFDNAGLQLVRSSLNQLEGSGLIGDGKGQTRIGAFQFGRNDYESLPLDRDANEIRDAINRILYQNSSRSNIAEAVTFAVQNKDFFGEARQTANRKVLVMLTDCLTNEGVQDFAPAKAEADRKGIEIFIVSYHSDVGELCKNTFTDSDPERYFLASDVHDVSQLIGCKSLSTPATPDTTDESNWYCLNGGTPGCHCPPGWTGAHCQTPINYCNETVIYDGEKEVHQLCHWHGVCKYDEVHGSECICNHPWTGPFCQHFNPNKTRESHRCLAYEDTCNGHSAGQETTTHNCSQYERCIPDNINCMFNMPTAQDGDGNAICAESDRWKCDGTCKCKHPIGWCIKLPSALRLFRAVSKSLQATRSLLKPLPQFQVQTEA